MTDRNDDRHDADGNGLSRRGFLKVLGVAGIAVTGVQRVQATESSEPSEDPYAVLVDTTRCAGCRNCEVVCAEAHGLPEPDLDEDVFARERNPSETGLSVINRFETDRGEFFAKRQCMHCVRPACASACLTHAMAKTSAGPVVWREPKCMGCRFCMVSCPFDMPKFEYNSAMPRIRKCDMCADRIAAGKQPACVENCPAEALTFGRRSELLAEARRRIVESPDDYHPAIYGERDAGGTSWMYLAAVPFEQIGLRTYLGETAYPEFSKTFLYSVPLVLILVPAFLLALSNATRRDGRTAAYGASDGDLELGTVERADGSAVNLALPPK
jgi:formate dehydrogenase iron-sulfur subunit